MARKWDSDPAPHRRLHRLDRGLDVEQLQRGLNARLEHIDDGGDFKVRLTSVVDDSTVRAWRKVRWAIGLPDGHPLTAGAQLNVRRPWTRTPLAPRRARARRRRATKPRMLTARQIGLSFQWVFGAKGPVERGTGHYTAGVRASGAQELAREMRSDHAYHASKGWGGLSYEAMVADDGTIGFGNPIGRRGAAVANSNTGMVNICCPGTTGDRMTAAQKASVRWLLANWHTSKVPAEHRLPRPARGVVWRGHKEWPGQATACPGEMLTDYKECF
jgi:hypothetical protein